MNYTSSYLYGFQRINSIYLGVFMLLFSHFAVVAKSQEINPGLLLDKKVNMTLYNVNVWNALNSLSFRAKMPIGFIGARGEKGIAKKICVQVEQKPVREVLDEIVRLDGRYRWEIINGIVNVVPISQEELAELKIGFLKLSDTELGDIGSAILDAPDVYASLIKLNKQKTEELDYSGPSAMKTKVSFVLSDTTIRNGLNTLLRERLARFWSFEILGENDELIRILLLD